MAKPGPKPKGKVKIEWSASLAYALGLVVTDGSVSKDGRHITLVSKDREQLLNFQKALKITAPISWTKSGYTGQQTSRVQFSDARFHEFLIGIGIMPNKTKIIGKVGIPAQYFFDFLRGHLDGDGCTYSYMDPRWRSSFMFYTNFVSASRAHILWLQEEIRKRLGTMGHISGSGRSKVCSLRYAKKDSLLLWKKLYYKDALCLSRKRLKIERILRIISEQEKNS